MGVRALLIRAAERFRSLAKPATPPKPKPSLLELFKSQVNEIHSKQALQQYNQDTLMWFTQSFAEGYLGVTVTKPNHKYFTTQWVWPDRSIYFGFEGGDNSARWRGIANEAIALSKKAGSKAIKLYILRTPDLSKVPRSTWKAIRPVIDEAISKGFQIINLTLDEVCELHAAREFYSSALQGNIDFNGPDTLAWLKKRFEPSFKRLAHPETPATKVTEVPTFSEDKKAIDTDKSELKEIVCNTLNQDQLSTVLVAVRKAKLIDIRTILKHLGGETYQEALLRSVEMHPNLKAHPGPQTIYIQWRIST